LFKFKLWKTFGIESAKYDHIWDYEQWVRLAEPAIAALHALGAGSELEPCVILSHEYMGMPTALAAIMEGELSRFRTIFYAHEVAPMRRIVEHNDGHDTMFYNVMSTAMSQGHFLEDVFGDQSDFYKSSLVKASRFCDGIFAVGDYTLKEIRFLGPDFVHVDAQVAYNGVPCWRISVEERMSSRRKLQEYCKTLLGFSPDYVFSHVTRLVPSKGMWRDLRVLEHVERMLRQRNETAVLLCAQHRSPRPPWRRHPPHGTRIPLARRPSRRPARSVQRRGRLLPGRSGIQRPQPQRQGDLHQSIRLRRQATCGARMPADMEFMDIRKGSDAEFGQSIYEPFGIAQVEPISFGGICIFTNVCGCAGFVDKANDGKPTPNVIVADYTNLPEKGLAPRTAPEHRP
jgi:hypothetical protein